MPTLSIGTPVNESRDSGAKPNLRNSQEESLHAPALCGLEQLVMAQTAPAQQEPYKSLIQYHPVALNGHLIQHRLVALNAFSCPLEAKCPLGGENDKHLICEMLLDIWDMF